MLKQFIISTGLLVLLAGTAAAANFRQADWGMSVKSVRAGERLTLAVANRTRTSTRLLGHTMFKTTACDVHYMFENDKLVAGAYTVPYPRPDKNICLRDYLYFYEMISKKNGTPKSLHNPITDNTTAADLGNGTVTNETTWLLGNGSVILEKFVIHNGKLSLLVRYSGKPAPTTALAKPARPQRSPAPAKKAPAPAKKAPVRRRRPPRP